MRLSLNSSCACRTKVLGRDVPAVAAAPKAAAPFDVGAIEDAWWSNFLRFAGLVSIMIRKYDGAWITRMSAVNEDWRL